MTIYTIGLTKNYEHYLREQHPPYKKGRTETYKGGWVWKTYMEASKNCPSDYSVYGVIANWDEDVLVEENQGYLLTDRPLVPTAQT